MQEISHEIIGVFVGRPKPLGEEGLISAMDKSAVIGELDVHFSYLPGDQVADTKHHGGTDRVIHHYSLEHYNHLKTIFPKHANQFVAGSFGENITTIHLNEKDLCLGDIFQLGTAKIEITEPRKPCRTIDVKYGIKGVLKEIVKSGRYGWFYRVLEEGKVAVGSQLTLLQRPYPHLNLDKIIFETYQSKDKNIAFLKETSSCPALSKQTTTYMDQIIHKVAPT